MSYFAGLLSAEELVAVVEQVKTFSTAFSQPRTPIEIPASIQVRLRVWPAEKRCSPRAAPHAMARTAGVASHWMMDQATLCFHAI